MYKAVFFDLDGTLTDSYEAIVTSFEYALKKKGITPIADEAVRRSYIGPALVLSYMKYYGVSRDEADELVELYRDVYRKGNMFLVKVYDGVTETLEELKNMGIRLFVVTSKPLDFATAVLEEAGLSVYFEKVQAPGFKDCEKSKAELISDLLEKCGLNAKDCLMVGDTKYDIEGGNAAGTDTAGVLYGYSAEGDFEKADYTVCGIKEIISIVKDIENTIREISCEKVTETVAELCKNANYHLNGDIKKALEDSIMHEQGGTGRNVLRTITQNAELASRKEVAICQDTGMAIIFADIGQNVHISGGNLEDAINEGVRKGYREGYMRCSVVEDPLRRKNTGDNTPAIIYYNIVPGDRLKLTVMPKGFGSENMSAVKMLKPSDGEDGVKDFIVDTVKKAGPNPCPPIVIGVGIGGSMDKAALLSKKALSRGIDTENPDKYYADMERELLDRINALGIGPAGLGGVTTALGVNIETYPTHIAGLPVAVTVSCHVTRHAEREI